VDILGPLVSLRPIVFATSFLSIKRANLSIVLAWLRKWIYKSRLQLPDFNENRAVSISISWPGILGVGTTSTHSLPETRPAWEAKSQSNA
jgi:hypothetical protein